MLILPIQEEHRLIVVIRDINNSVLIIKLHSDAVERDAESFFDS